MIKIMQKSKIYGNILTITIVNMVLLAILNGGSSYATHFRFGKIFWIPGANPNEVEFTVQNAWRRSAYSTGNGRCIDVTTLTSTACSGADGFADVGDVIFEDQGGTKFNPGDATGLIGSPSPFFQLLYLVTSADAVNNWIFGEALDPNSLPSIDTAISHIYSQVGNFTAVVNDCCRISGILPPNEHINNPDIHYRIETIVNVDTGNRSPTSVLPPIVSCPQNAPCSFSVLGADPDGDALTFRLSTSMEASGSPSFVQPGPPFAPNAASIDLNTGVYTWDTTGATLASNPANNTLYSTQVTIEDSAGSKCALDFLIRLVPVVAFDVPPTPVCGSTLGVSVGNTLNFTVQASGPDLGGTVTLNAVGLPPGAVMTPGLITSGNPVSSAFSWTPTAADVGFRVVSFSATDDNGLQDICSITIEVGTTIVTLVSFGATSSESDVNISWETATEIDNAGFNIWRSEGEAENFTKINEFLIPAEGGETWGAEYSYTDSDVVPGQTYHYQLEDVEFDGDSALHGPVLVTVEDKRRRLIDRIRDRE